MTDPTFSASPVPAAASGDAPDWDGSTILITGGTGSFGKKFVETVLERHRPRKLIIFSRDELKQFEMAQVFRPADHPALRYFIGDVRDRERLYRAFDEVDIVVHAAAMKQVPTAEYNPIEAIRTNVDGASNIIDAAIDRGVKRVIALSTDKAVNPVNLYGATKLCSDKLFVAGNHYAGPKRTRFSLVRYGNVVGSRGSVIPLFKRLKETGRLPITDDRMTRFWITLEQGVDLVLKALHRMGGGEVYVPKIPSMKITDLAKAIGPECELDVVGVRPGEKLHEVMITEDDARNTVEYDDHYTILPEDLRMKRGETESGGRRCEPNFRYSSETNDRWLTAEQLREIADAA
ncbi:MAG: UDP-N-acetylglucosamine 4,6-dehydratase (inverting) [Planctomycetota bacterium]